MNAAKEAELDALWATYQAKLADVHCYAATKHQLERQIEDLREELALAGELTMTNHPCDFAYSSRPGHSCGRPASRLYDGGAHGIVYACAVHVGEFDDVKAAEFEPLAHAAN